MLAPLAADRETVSQMDLNLFEDRKMYRESFLALIRFLYPSISTPRAGMLLRDLAGGTGTYRGAAGGRVRAIESLLD